MPDFDWLGYTPVFVRRLLGGGAPSGSTKMVFGIWAAASAAGLALNVDGMKNICLGLAVGFVALGYKIMSSPRDHGRFWAFNIANKWLQPTGQFALHHILNTTKAGDAVAIYDAMDALGWSGHFMMNLGDDKGKIVDAVIKEHKPKVLVELGAHLGYSTLRFAHAMPQKGSVLYSVEPDAFGHAIQSALLAHAQLSHLVKPIFKYSSDFLRELAARGEKIDFLFVDHVKMLYRSDLELAMELDVLADGCVVVGDNVLMPGAPEFKELVTTDPHFKTTVETSWLEYSKTIPDEVTISIYRRKL